MRKSAHGREHNERAPGSQGNPKNFGPRDEDRRNHEAGRQQQKQRNGVIALSSDRKIVDFASDLKGLTEGSGTVTHAQCQDTATKLFSLSETLVQLENNSVHYNALSVRKNNEKFANVERQYLHESRGKRLALTEESMFSQAVQDAELNLATAKLNVQHAVDLRKNADGIRLETGNRHLKTLKARSDAHARNAKLITEFEHDEFEELPLRTAVLTARADLAGKDVSNEGRATLDLDARIRAQQSVEAKVRMENIYSDPENVAIIAANVTNMAAHLRATEADRYYIAESLYKEEDLRAHGRKADMSLKLEQITYECHEASMLVVLDRDYRHPAWCEENPMYLDIKFPRTNVRAHLAERTRLTVPLVPVPFFIREDRETVMRWIARVALKPFYHLNRDEVAELDSKWLCRENARVHYPVQGMYDNAQFNRHLDKSVLVSLLANFRFLGIESEFVRDLFTSKNDFCVRNKLTKMTILDVHPVVYQQAVHLALGKSVTQVMVDQIVGDFKKWYEFLPCDLVVNSVTAGCQAANAMMNLKAAGFAKVEVVARTA